MTRASSALLIRRFAPAVVLAFVGTASPAAAQSTPAPVAATACPASTAAAPPFTASAGTTILSSGASVFTHDGSNATIVVHVPVSGAVDLSKVAALDAGDTAIPALSPDGKSVDITWTLADPNAALRRLAVAGALRTIRAINLRGLAACVTPQDVVDLPLPASLGTLHLAVRGDETQLVASTGPTDALAITGSVTLPALDAKLEVKGRFDPSDATRIANLGALALATAADGLDLSAGGTGDVIGADGLRIKLQRFAMHVSRVPSATTATIAFTPVLSASLPFSIGTVSATVADAGGRIALQCGGPTPISFASADLAIGSGPFKDLHLVADPTSSSLTCAGGRYTGFDTVLALRWDSVFKNGPLKLRLSAAPGAGVRIALASGGAPSLPDLDLGSDALGLRLTVAAPKLEVDPSGDNVRINGSVALKFVSAGLATNPLPLAVAFRPSGGGLSAAVTCTADNEKTSAPPVGGAFALPFSLACSKNGTVDGVKSDGGAIDLPAKAGGLRVRVPSFTLSLADGTFDARDKSVIVTSPTATGSILDLGIGSIKELRIDYKAADGLRVIGTATLSLATGQDAAHAITIKDVAIGRRDDGRLGVLDVGGINVPDGFAIGGITLSALHTGDACAQATSLVEKVFDRPAERLTLKICAVAALPDFIRPKSTNVRVGDLASGGGLIQPGFARAAVKFNGLVVGRNGVPEPDAKSQAKRCPVGAKPPDEPNPDQELLDSERNETVDCRVQVDIESNVALGALELHRIEINLVTKLSDDTTVPAKPQFRILALVKFGKYLSADGPASGVINAQFNNRRMVVSGHFSSVVSVRFGVVSAGIRGFSMDFSDQQRSFIAEGGQLSAGTGINTTTLYFSEIAFVEVRDKTGTDFHLAKLRAPIDVKRTGIGLLFRLVTDLGSSSFLHLFKLPR